MNDILNNLSKKPPLKISDYYRVLGDDAFFILSNCVNTKNHILVKDRVYQIVDFLKNAETHITTIKFKEAYLKGYEVYVVGIEIVTGELTFFYSPFLVPQKACILLKRPYSQGKEKAECGVRY